MHRMGLVSCFWMLAMVAVFWSWRPMVFFTLPVWGQFHSICFMSICTSLVSSASNVAVQHNKLAVLSAGLRAPNPVLSFHIHHFSCRLVLYLEWFKKPMTCPNSPGVVTVNWLMNTTSPGKLDFKILLALPLVCHGLPYLHLALLGISKLDSLVSTHPSAAMNLIVAQQP